MLPHGSLCANSSPILIFEKLPKGRILPDIAEDFFLLMLLPAITSALRSARYVFSQSRRNMNRYCRQVPRMQPIMRLKHISQLEPQIMKALLQQDMIGQNISTMERHISKRHNLGLQIACHHVFRSVESWRYSDVEILCFSHSVLESVVNQNMESGRMECSCVHLDKEFLSSDSDTSVISSIPDHGRMSTTLTMMMQQWYLSSNLRCFATRSND